MSPAVVDRLRDGAPVRLLGVWAHPDDEAYLSAGLMMRVARAGGQVACLTATRGEAGVAPDDPRSPAAVQRQRAAELRESLAVVGAHSLRLLHHPDGGCAKVPLEVGVADVVRAIDATRPDVIVTFGPDGITGHPDHVAVHRWVTEAHRRRPGATVLHAAKTDEFLRRYDDLHRRIGFYATDQPHPGWPAGDLDLVLDLDGHELDRKRLALAAHASQTDGLAALMGEAAYRAWAGDERFRLAPSADPGRVVGEARTDVRRCLPVSASTDPVLTTR